MIHFFFLVLCWKQNQKTASAYNPRKWASARQEWNGTTTITKTSSAKISSMADHLPALNIQLMMNLEMKLLFGQSTLKTVKHIDK